ncbi:MAG: mechanosensitive ion channel family protein [Candidatus Absconditabacteria bacterium]
MGTGDIASTGIQSLMDSVIVTYLIKIVGAIIVIFILLMVSKVFAKIISKKIVQNTTEGNKHVDKIEKLIHDIVFYVLVIFSFFVGFEIVGFNVGLIIGGISFGVGLAFKEILGNMIAGMMILYTKEFKMGDIVEITADQVYFGRIEEITIRYTIIRTLDLRQVVLPNMLLISTPIKTFSSEDLVKLNAVFGVHYNSDVAQVLDVVTKTINTLEYVKEKENTKTFVSNFADSYIEIKSFFYFDPKCGIIPEVALGEINNAMNIAFIQNKIEVPYNILTVNFENNQDKAKLESHLQTNNTNQTTA